jgi:ABC-type transporter Mla MlaB component
LIPLGPARDDDPVAGARESDAFGLRLQRLDPSRMVLYVSGELDRLTAPVLAACLDELLGSDPPDTSLTIDLTETSFVDVGGLNTLLDVQRRARVRGIVVHVGGCGAQFLRLLHATQTIGLTAKAPDRPRSCRPRACRPFGGRLRRR